MKKSKNLILDEDKFKLTKSSVSTKASGGRGEVSPAIF